MFPNTYGITHTNTYHIRSLLSAALASRTCRNNSYRVAAKKKSPLGIEADIDGIGERHRSSSIGIGIDVDIGIGIGIGRFLEYRKIIEYRVSFRRSKKSYDTVVGLDL